MSSACDGAASATTPSSSGPDGDNVTSRIALRGTHDRTMSGMTARTRRVRPQCGMSGSAWSGGRSCVAATSLRCVGSLSASLSGSARQHRTGRRPTSQRVRALEAAVRGTLLRVRVPGCRGADDDPEGGNPQAQGVEHQCDEEVAPRLAQSQLTGELCRGLDEAVTVMRTIKLMTRDFTIGVLPGMRSGSLSKPRARDGAVGRLPAGPAHRVDPLGARPAHYGRDPRRRLAAQAPSARRRHRPAALNGPRHIERTPP